MTEEDQVLRRRTRACLRLAHILEGATPEEIDAYKAMNKDTLQNPLEVTSDFFMNKKGAVQPIQGDANLDQIADVKELKRDFFAGSGVPEHMLGYVEGVNRDIFADSLEAYYEILEDVQELQADGYEDGFRLQLLLKGINADGYEWELKFKGRKVESDNQLADRMLKHMSLGIPPAMIWPQMGYDAEAVKTARDKAAKEKDPYQDRLDQELGGANGKGNQIKNVNGNARKG
jgi:hypothetical protein